MNTTTQGAQVAPTNPCVLPEDPDAPPAPPPPPVCERCRDVLEIDLDGNVIKARGEDYPA